MCADGFVDVTDVDYVGLVEFNRMRVRRAPEQGDILISCSGLVWVASQPCQMGCTLFLSEVQLS